MMTRRLAKKLILRGLLYPDPPRDNYSECFPPGVPERYGVARGRWLEARAAAGPKWRPSNEHVRRRNARLDRRYG